MAASSIQIQFDWVWLGRVHGIDLSKWYRQIASPATLHQGVWMLTSWNQPLHQVLKRFKNVCFAADIRQDNNNRRYVVFGCSSVKQTQLSSCYHEIEKHLWSIIYYSNTDVIQTENCVGKEARKHFLAEISVALKTVYLNRRVRNFLVLVRTDKLILSLTYSTAFGFSVIVVMLHFWASFFPLSTVS